MKKGIIILFLFICCNANAATIGLDDFHDSAITIDFSDIQFTDPNSGNGALTPATDYLDGNSTLMAVPLIGKQHRFMFQNGPEVKMCKLNSASLIGDKKLTQRSISVTSVQRLPPSPNREQSSYWPNRNIGAI
jgi:hypothetical protein